MSSGHESDRDRQQRARKGYERCESWSATALGGALFIAAGVPLWSAVVIGVGFFLVAVALRYREAD